LSDEASQSVRVSDVPGRYGGEEFCLLLPETRSEGASAVANRIRKTLSEQEFTTDDGRSFTVTCSIGVAERKPEMKHPEKLVQAADNALYDAKNSGRNRVVIHKTMDQGPEDDA
ncbi:MAG: GGDEF domain-containing protein, partial [bacterium]